MTSPEIDKRQLAIQHRQEFVAPLTARSFPTLLRELQSIIGRLESIGLRVSPSSRLASYLRTVERGLSSRQHWEGLEARVVHQACAEATQLSTILEQFLSDDADHDFRGKARALL